MYENILCNRIKKSTWHNYKSLKGTKKVWRTNRTVGHMTSIPTYKKPDPDIQALWETY